MEIGLSLGSNQGDRFGNLVEARRLVCAIPGVTLLEASRVYETDPVGVAPEFRILPFLNAVLIVEYKPGPQGLLQLLQTIERDMGRRQSSVRNSPRSLDIDIIYAGKDVVKTPDLSVPHPRWAERRFVVQPLSEVRPNLRLPGENRSVKEVLNGIPLTPMVSPHSVQWEAGRNRPSGTGRNDR